MKLAKDASRWHRLWSMRVALFWIAANGAVASLDAFSNTSLVSDHPFAFMGVNVLGTVTIGLARLLKQPGLK